MNTPELLRLKNIRGVGPKRFNSILATLDKLGLPVERLFTMSSTEIAQTFKIPKNVAEAIANAPIPSADDPEAKLLESKQIKILTRGTDEYPKRLEQILGDSAPHTLYVWGNLNLLKKPAVGFCGSRSATEKGIEVTEDTARQITESDWVVVSGHARGVDSKAHQTALENGGGTIIVAAEGILNFKLRRELKKIAKPEQVLVISEFPPNAHWNVGNAMARNRIIIALSDAMVLIESRREGGTFEAGKTALKLKVPLFVAQYQTPGESAAGNEYFLKRGAEKLRKNLDTGKASIEALRNVVNRYSKAFQTANGTHEHQPKQLSLI